MSRIIKAPTIRSRPMLLPSDAAGNDEVVRDRTSAALETALHSFEPAAVAAEAVAGASIMARETRDIQKSIELSLDDAEKQARERGYEAGRAQGLNEAEAEFKSRVERLESIIAAFERARAECIAAAEDDAVAIAFEAVTRMLGIGSASLDSIKAVVAEIGRSQPDCGPVVLRVHSSDYEALVAEPFVAALEDDQQKIRLVEDPRVVLGGCIVETDRGALDARIETQLDRLRKILLEARATSA
jgi:flagellar assembly protein FliH